MPRKPDWVHQLPDKYATMSNRELLEEFCQVMACCNCCSGSRMEEQYIAWEQEAVYRALTERLGSWLEEPGFGS